MKKEELFLTLQYDSQEQKIFSIYERILIHKGIIAIERGEEPEIPKYLKQRVLALLEEIKRQEWEPYKF